MKSLLRFLAAGVTLALATVANAQFNATVDPTAPWIGYMNVFNLPSAGGAFQFGQAWGTADLAAVFSGAVLTLSPNSINDPSSYWYTPSGGPGAQGNKTMDANMYVEDSTTLPGQTINFSGLVLANTLVSPYTTVAFIKDFAADYSSSVSVTAPLTAGIFNLSLATVVGTHVQYGFETIGPDVWITDVGQFGSVQITQVPEPAAMALLAVGALSLIARRNRKNA